MVTSRDDLRAALRSSEHWNHNTHYHRLLAGVATPPWRHVLDVGCGEGLLTRRLAPFAGRVTGIDTDAEMVGRARGTAPANATYVRGDVLTADLPGPYDLVTCFAVLHHVGLRPGLERLRELTAPGGTLVVVGLARPDTPARLAWSALGVPVAAAARRLRGTWDPGAPIADEDATLGEVRSVASGLLPGVRWRNHVYWRYSLVWTRPPSS